MEQAIKITRRAIAALDLSAENDRLAELKTERGRINAAIDAATRRIAEIGREKTSYAERGPDGRTVADRLLHNLSASDAALAAPTPESMETERLALVAATKELRERENVIRTEEQFVMTAASSKAAEAATPLVQAMVDEAREHLQRLIELFASVTAVCDAARAGIEGKIELTDCIKSMSGGLLPLPRTIPVPADIQALVEPLGRKGDALRAGLTRMVPFPR
jgi:hypothetical protein